MSQSLTTYLSCRSWVILIAGVLLESLREVDQTASVDSAGWHRLCSMQIDVHDSGREVVLARSAEFI